MSEDPTTAPAQPPWVKVPPAGADELRCAFGDALERAGFKLTPDAVRYLERLCSRLWIRQCSDHWRLAELDCHVLHESKRRTLIMRGTELDSGAIVELRVVNFLPSEIRQTPTITRLEVLFDNQEMSEDLWEALIYSGYRPQEIPLVFEDFLDIFLDAEEEKIQAPHPSSAVAADLSPGLLAGNNPISRTDSRTALLVALAARRMERRFGVSLV